MAVTPTLADIIAAAQDARDGERAHVIPAKVATYDSAKNTVDCQVMVRRPVEGSDGSTVNEEWPVIPACPVIWSQTTGYALTFPINPGDFGMLLVLTYSASSFLDTGAVSDAGDIRHSHIANAVFLPGFGPKSTKPTYAGDPDVVLEPGSAGIRLGGAATKKVALAELVVQRFTDFVGAFLSAVPTPNDGGAAIQAYVKAQLGTDGWNVLTGAPPSVGSSKVKAAD
jgi:hypothetical protein